jgi:membrane-associated HD superfamily phosphohydrolase
MAKKEQIKPEAWVRLVIFVAIVAGGWWFLSKHLETKSESSGSVSGESSQLEQLLPESLSNTVKVLGEKAAAAVPDSVKKGVEEKVFQQTQDLVKKNRVAEEIKKTIITATDQISGFPEKQTTEIKKEVVRQVCDEIIQKLDEDRGN